jgi:tRNA(Arg) A34 adenosine deaminase TadA
MAVGSVVKDGEVMARGRNEATSTFDVTAHAGTVVIRNVIALLCLM